MMMLAEGIKKAQSFNVSDVRKALLETENFNGLEEKYKLDKFGDADRKSSLVQIVDGKFEVIND